MKDEYVYYCPMRHPTLGAVPMNGLLYMEPLTERRMEASINREIWGWAVYNRPLTVEEIAEYELISKE